MDPWIRHAVDVGALVLAAAGVLAYHLRLVWRTRRNPAYTIQGMAGRARAAWVRRVIQRDLDILAVQTLRNSTMAASLMASTAVLLIFGILNLLASKEEVSFAFRSLNATGSVAPAVVSLKILLMLVAFFTAFFAFAMAVRSYNHAGFLVNVPRDGESPEGVSEGRIVRVLDRGALSYSVGMRSFLVAVPLVIWLFGPVWLLLATAALLAVLHHIDHLPE